MNDVEKHKLGNCLVRTLAPSGQSWLWLMIFLVLHTMNPSQPKAGKAFDPRDKSPLLTKLKWDILLQFLVLFFFFREFTDV